MTRRFPPFFIFAFSLVIRLAGIANVDEAWDEVPVVRYGEIYLNYLKDFDFSRESWSLNKEHPPFSKYFYGATRLVSLNVPFFRDKLDQDYPLGRRYTFQRIVSAILGSLTVVLVYLFGKDILGSLRIGILSSLILSLTPYFIAHNRIATQETLVCFLLTLATYLFALGVKEAKKRPVLGPALRPVRRSAPSPKRLWRVGDLGEGGSLGEGGERTGLSASFIRSGLILGLAISTKYNSFLFLVFYFAATLLFFGRDFLKSPKKIFKNHIILIPLIASGVLVLIWPWLWSNPILQFLDSLSRIESSRFQEYFLGVFGQQPPWYYFFVYFAVTTPPILLTLLSLFAFCLLKGSTLSRVEPSWMWFILFWFLTPFLASFIPLRQDGIRYIFPMYPALALACGLGLDLPASLLDGKTRPFLGRKSSGTDFPAPFLAGSLITVGCLLVTTFRFHPYYLDYYNSLSGGPKQVYAKRLFDFGYWGEGIRGAVRWVNRNAEPNSTIGFNFVPRHVAPNLRPDLKLIENASEADYIIWNVEGERRGVQVPNPGSYDTVYTEKVVGVPLVSISKRR